MEGDFPEMGEEADATDFDLLDSGTLEKAVEGGGDEGGERRVLEWEAGLPSGEDLTPLSQMLIPPVLASAFSMPLVELKTMLDVHHAAQHTISNLRRHHQNSASGHLAATYKRYKSSATDDRVLLESVDRKECFNSGKDVPMMDPVADSFVTGTAVIEGILSPFPAENSVEDNSTRTSKRPRMVWTPQLHKRFMDVVSHLGIKNAVPKTIMQLMNVEGLTRENVASHLQKYRLFLKRIQGDTDEGPSSSFDPLFASMPVLQSFHEQQLQQPMQMQMPYTVPVMIPMPVYGMPHHHTHGVVPGGVFPENGHPYVPNNWLGSNNFGSVVSYPHFFPKNT
ncbi:hypothetical protein HPP92_020755 [Vanilla planifolia]|uniref:HTH myb-type domain-containing protein n=1 Tax=Vanilla planifolia TaxID=51239 RepID=A0A835UGJ6_VANPL|nr:hypothetical protein HPP92_020755 [Vanilla planifolia]